LYAMPLKDAGKSKSAAGNPPPARATRRKRAR
jgi:hypothetical protein